MKLVKNALVGAVPCLKNLNVGKIAGGDWASSVPAWCTVDFRMGLFPGQDMAAAKDEIETVVRKPQAAGVHNG